MPWTSERIERYVCIIACGRRPKVGKSVAYDSSIVVSVIKKDASALMIEAFAIKKK